MSLFKKDRKPHGSLTHFPPCLLTLPGMHLRTQMFLTLKLPTLLIGLARVMNVTFFVFPPTYIPV